MKTSELSGAALDWAVTHANYEINGAHIWATENCNYSSDWALAGPIVERECIAISCLGITGYTPDTWHAQHPQRAFAKGKTPLIAAMRCYVASKLGDEVQLPEELDHETI